jgi:hypothetical protein
MCIWKGERNNFWHNYCIKTKVICICLCVYINTYMETREKQLLTQLLYKNNGNIVCIFERLLYDGNMHIFVYVYMYMFI